MAARSFVRSSARRTTGGRPSTEDALGQCEAGTAAPASVEHLSGPPVSRFSNDSARGRRSSLTAAWARSFPPPSPGSAARRRRTSRPAIVSLRVGFINAGAELIETNSFRANRRKLATGHLEDEFERINSTAVKLSEMPAR